MLSSILSNQRILRLILIPLLLFLLPAVYVDTHTSLWTARLTAASIRPSPQEAVLLIKGLSLPSRAPPPNVALCITQQSDLPPKQSVYRSIHQRIVQVLKDRGYSVHVFLQLVQEKSESNRSIEVPSYAVRDMLRLLQPVTITYHSELNSCLLARCAKSGVKCPLALLRAQQCHDHIVNYEKRTEVSFNWVYKTRLDVALGANITSPTELEHDIIYTNQHIPTRATHVHTVLRKMFSDHGTAISGPVSHYIVVASRSTAEVVFNAVEAFNECALYDLPVNAVNDEVGLAYWLVSRGVRYKTMPWFWMLVTKSAGPNCRHVRSIRDKKHTHDPSLVKRCLAYKQTNRIPDL